MIQKIVIKKHWLWVVVAVIIIPFVFQKRVMLASKSEVEKQVNGGMVVTNKGTLPESVVKLLNALGVLHDGSLADVVRKTQQEWLRPQGVELWEITDSHKQCYDKVLPLLEEIGCVQEVLPSRSVYDYLLLHGALVTRVRSRLAFAKKLWERGIRFRHVVFLTGQRKLHPTLESKEILLDSKNNILPIKKGWSLSGDIPLLEEEMMRLVYEQADLPSAMKNLPKTFVSAPERVLPDGSTSRPTTQGTIDSWLASSPVPGTCLAISNQPYIGRQHAVLKTLLPNTFEIESVGNGVNVEMRNIRLFLDTIARWLYQEQMYYKYKKS